MGISRALYVLLAIVAFRSGNQAGRLWFNDLVFVDGSLFIATRVKQSLEE